MDAIVIEPNLRIRNEISQKLEQSSWINVVAHKSFQADIAYAAQQMQPKVIITNLLFEKRTTEEAIETLNIIRRLSKATNIKFIILTECANTAVYQYGMLSGIYGYIHTQSGREINLAKTVENMIKGPKIQPSSRWLNIKEWTVCHSLTAFPGATSSERAQMLKMSVSNYYRLLKLSQEKTGAQNNLELAIKFLSPMTSLAS